MEQRSGAQTQLPLTKHPIENRVSDHEQLLRLLGDLLMSVLDKRPDQLQTEGSADE